jgi:two-component system, response regulator RegA
MTMIRGCAVLLADDDTTWARSIGDHLTAQGSSVVGATTLEQVQQCLTLQSFSALVMEPNLPGTTWFQVLRSMVAVAKTTRVAIVTAYASQAMVREARALSPVAFATKPACARSVMGALIGGTPTSRWDLVYPSVTLARVEWEHINDRLAHAGGNLSLAARHLGIPRQTLYRKLRKHPPGEPVLPGGR